MMLQIWSRVLRGLTCLGFSLALASGAFAADGITLINQAAALAGSVTSGDSAGFPVTLSEGGSFRLVGNLTVANENTTAMPMQAA